MIYFQHASLPFIPALLLLCEFACSTFITPQYNIPTLAHLDHTFLLDFAFLTHTEHEIGLNYDRVTEKSQR